MISLQNRVGADEPSNLKCVLKSYATDMPCLSMTLRVASLLRINVRHATDLSKQRYKLISCIWIGG
jgi:hypothetical protein